MNNSTKLSKGLHMVVLATTVLLLSFSVTSVQAAEKIDIAKSVLVNGEKINFAKHGDLVTYTIKVTNNFYCGGETLIITDEMSFVPDKATIIEAPNAVQKGNTLTWTLSNFNCNTSKEVTATVKVADTASDGSFMQNRAWVEVERIKNSNVLSNPVSTEINVPTQMIIVPSAVLSLIKTADKATASPGDELTYTVTISNSGDGDATNVLLVDVLPAGFTFADEKGMNTGDTEKTWKWIKLNAGDDLTVTYDVLIDSQAGLDTYENLATVSADEVHEVTDSAITTLKITKVLGEETPTLTITKAANKEFANPGETATYTVVITNDGNAPANNTVLIDSLPTGFVFADTGETTATWKLGDLVPTEEVTKTYEVKIDASTLAGKYVNTAVVKADDVPSISASATIEVKEVKVLGAEIDEEAILPVTGGSIAIALLGGISLLGSGIFIRRKVR